jgi:predicted RNA binding protein YcfA (HicA-like mRNA interferase family)
MREGSTLRLSIPIHGDRPLKSGLLGHLLKQAEIPIEDV